ncbi:MAG: TonB-dependent siderophore receptor [Bacteroidota bacterium]
MKRILTVFFILSIAFAKAQTISGLVKDAYTNEAIIGASVKLLKSKIGVVTDKEGKFLLNGEGSIQISNVGYKSYIIKADGTILAISLVPEIINLQNVEVVGRAVKDYNSEYTFSATRTSTLNKDIPQTISTVTKELIADRQAFTLGEAVKIAPGVTPTSWYNQYNIRGISQNEEGQIINGMRTRQYFFLQPLTANIERVEVLKGPASATFSSVDPGGSINMVTKKPLAIYRKEVSLSVASFSTFRGMLDFTGPINKDKTLLYRINGAYQEARNFRDIVSNKSVILSPSISYIPNDKTAINTELIFSNMQGTLDRGQPVFGAIAGKTDLFSTSKSLNLGSATDFFRSKEVIITGTLSHKFTKNIVFNTSYMKQSWSEDLQEHRTNNSFAVDILNQPVNTLAFMQFVQRKQVWNVDNLNSYFNFDFNTGKAKHKLLVGFDLHSWHKLIGGGQNAARGYLLKDGSVAASFVLANAANYQTVKLGNVTLPKPNVNFFDLANPTYGLRNIQEYNFNVRTVIPSALTTSNAIFIQEQFQLNKLSLLLSLRNEWFEDITNYKTKKSSSFKNNNLIPRIGFTYAMNKNLNVYGTYLQGFQPQSNTVSLMPSTGAFFWADNSPALYKPLISDLKEIGVKADLFGNTLKMNLALYEINQKNILISANDPTQPDLLVQRGADHSRGFEWDIAGYLTQNWQINASFSFIDAKIITDFNEKLNGQRKENTPRNSYNLWNRYNFKEKSLFKDLGIGIGMQHQASRLPWLSREFEIPAFTTFDFALYYTPTKSNVQVALNMYNMFDKNYWIGAFNYLRMFPGAPRNAALTLTYKF